jgi:hypothetical protein
VEVALDSFHCFFESSRRPLVIGRQHFFGRYKIIVAEIVSILLLLLLRRCLGWSLQQAGCLLVVVLTRKTSFFDFFVTWLWVCLQI